MKRLAVLVLLMIALTGCGHTWRHALPTATPEWLIVRPTRTPEPTPEVFSGILTVTAKAGANGGEMIRIDGVSRGVYGRTVVTNADTDARLEYIGYFVPAGQYKATNNRPYQDQINILSPNTVWQGGFEYPADAQAVVVKPGESVTFSVPSGYYIKVVPPSDITLVRK